jgi:hypothetical protein
MFTRSGCSPKDESLSPRSSELDLALEEEGDDQSVDAQRLDESQTDDHRGLDLAGRAGVAGDALQHAESGEALTNTTTESGETDSNTGTECDHSLVTSGNTRAITGSESESGKESRCEDRQRNEQSRQLRHEK